MVRDGFDRRTFIKGAGVAAGTALAPGTATAAVDHRLDTDGGHQEVIVVFADGADPEVLDAYDLRDGYYAFDVLPFAYTRATGDQIGTIAAREDVRYLEKNRRLDLHNDDGRQLTGAERVHEDLGVTGDGVHAVVIDTGLTQHPDLTDHVEHNYHWVDPLSTDEDQVWVDATRAADTDDIGHGSHVAGSLAGDGQMSDGRYAGTAPDAAITGYATNSGLYVVMLAAAIADVIRKQRDGDIDVQIINNSFGLSNDGDFNPASAVHISYWEAFTEGIVPVFAAGNSGPDHGTLNYLGKQPYSLCVAATHTGDEGPPKRPTEFSSRGRPPVADTEEPYTDDYDYSIYEENEGPNYDRRAALRNVKQFYDSGQAEAAEVDADYRTSFSTTIGTTVSDPTALVDVLGVDRTLVGGESAYVEWESPDGAGFLDATLTLTPDRQSVFVAVYEGSAENGVLVARDGGIIPVEDALEIRAPIEPNQTYTFEFTGYNNVRTRVDAELTARESVPRPQGPFGTYRCDVGAPGNAITSTNTPKEAFGAISEASDADPWYADLSGTSMSCPLTAGVVALVFEAYCNEADRYPKPVDVINIVEASAEGGTDAERPEHTEANMGAGFVDARAAVELARNLAASEQGRSGPAAENPTVADHPQLWKEVELCSYEVEADDGTVVAEEVVDRASFSGDLLVGAGAPAGANEETTAVFGTESFATSDLPEARMDVTITVDGPPGFDWSQLDVEHRRDGEWVLIGAKRSDTADGSITVEDGETGEFATAEAVVADGEDYRITVRASTSLDTVVTYDVDVDFVAYETA